MSLPPSSLKKEFIDLFNSIASHEHRYTVFSDFVTMSAISFHNAIVKSEPLETEPTDILGQLYMELELGNEHVGQFFTPPQLSEMLARLVHGDVLSKQDKPFVTMSDPCCGAGGMVLAFVKEMLNQKHDPARKLWVQCIDIDRTAAMMCYLQLTLWNVPAQVLVGNTLSMKIREQLFTPAHYLNGWNEKLKQKKLVDFALKLEKSSDDLSEEAVRSVSSETRILTEGQQLDIFDNS